MPFSPELRRRLLAHHNEVAARHLAALEELTAMTQGTKHCFDYIFDPSQPLVFRQWLTLQRLSAAERMLIDPLIPHEPIVYATLGGQRCFLVLASSLGDIGVNFDLSLAGKDDAPYTHRTPVDQLTDISGLKNGSPMANGSGSNLVPGA